MKKIQTYKVFNESINDNNLKINGSNGFYDILLNDKEIGSFTLIKFGSFMKIYRIKDVFQKYNLDLDINNGLELATIEMYDKYQNKGYGKEIMNKIINLAKEKQAKFIALEPSHYKTKTDFLISFYSKFGFDLYKMEDGNYMIKELY